MCVLESSHVLIVLNANADTFINFIFLLCNRRHGFDGGRLGDIASNGSFK